MDHQQRAYLITSLEPIISDFPLILQDCELLFITYISNNNNNDNDKSQQNIQHDDHNNADFSWEGQIPGLADLAPQGPAHNALSAICVYDS